MDERMTPEELDQIAETEREAQSQFTQRVNVCVAAGCLSCQSQAVKDALDQEVDAPRHEGSLPGQGRGLHGAVLGRAAGFDQRTECCTRKWKPPTAPRFSTA